MPLSIHHVQHADLPRIFDVFYASMAAISLLRATGDIPNLETSSSSSSFESRFESAREDAIARFAEILSTHPKTHFLKAEDDETGEIAAFAIWYFFTGADGRADWMAYTETAEGMAVPRGVAEEGYRYAWGRMHETYREVFGGVDGWREHYHLALLATHPDHERRGAGSKLLHWAFQQADRDGLECHVEASAPGYPLYRRKGFVDALGSGRSHIGFDVGRFTGIEGECVDLTAMVRPAKLA